MAAQRSHYPDPYANPYQSPGYVSYSQDPRSNQHPGAYDHAPLTNPPITQPAEWHLPERPVGFDGLPVFPARPPQPYIPRYMNEREAALLQSAPRYETQQLTGPGHLSYLDTPAYNPASRSYPYQPDTRHLIPRPTCQRCGQSNCLCNRSRPCSRPPSVANSMCQRASGAGCMYPTKTAELITEQACGPAGFCRRCGATCACNCSVAGQKICPTPVPMSAPPTTSPAQVRNWMNLPHDAPKMKDRLHQFRQDHKISGYAGFFPNTHNMLGGSIYRLTTNER